MSTGEMIPIEDIDDDGQFGMKKDEDLVWDRKGPRQNRESKIAKVRIAEDLVTMAKFFLAEENDYQEYFQDKMEEEGVDSPAEIPEEDKDDFFEEVDEGWDAENESDKEAGDDGEINIAEALVEVAKMLQAGSQEEYQKYFQDKMDDYGVDSPEDIPDEKKDDFFDEVDEGWDAENEEDEDGMVAIASALGKIAKMLLSEDTDTDTDTDVEVDVEGIKDFLTSDWDGSNESQSVNQLVKLGMERSNAKKLYDDYSKAGPHRTGNMFKQERHLDKMVQKYI